MKLPKEFTNGLLIFLGIGVFFMAMNVLNLADLIYLRLFNVVFLFYGVNKTIVSNIIDGKKEFLPNAISALVTCLVGVFLSIIGLVVYSHVKGGDAYVHNLSKTFLFGGNPSVNTYCISLLFEGIASAVIITLLLMLYYNSKYNAD